MSKGESGPQKQFGEGGVDSSYKQIQVQQERALSGGLFRSLLEEQVTHQSRLYCGDALDRREGSSSKELRGALLVVPYAFEQMQRTVI